LTIFVNQREYTISSAGWIDLQTNFFAEPTTNRGIVSIAASPSTLKLVSSHIDASPLQEATRQVSVRDVFRQHDNPAVAAHA